MRHREASEIIRLEVAPIETTGHNIYCYSVAVTLGCIGEMQASTEASFRQGAGMMIEFQ